VKGRRPPVGPAKGEELEALYTQLAQSAARLMVVHEASTILRSTHDAEELAKSLLGIIAEAVFASSGCVAALKGERLEMLATRGLEEHEADALVADPREAAVWFEVVERVEARSRQELVATLNLAGPPDDDSDESTEDAEIIERSEDEATEDAPDEPGDGSEDMDADASEEPDDEAGGTEEDSEIEESSDAPADLPDEEESGTPVDADGSSPAFEFYVPLRVEDDTLGVLALGRRVDGRPYGEDERQLAVSLASHLALALDHSALFAERNQRIEHLGVLLKISREITSSLDLERVLTTVTHMTEMILPNRRTTIALVEGGSVKLRASSEIGFKPKESGQDPLLAVLQWAQGAHQSINTCRQALESDLDADGRNVLLSRLGGANDPKGLAVLPLEDDQGMLGLLAIETDVDAPPLDDEREELVTILSNQVAVSIRNAELYQRVPMIGLLEPLLGKARRIRTADRRKLWTRGGIAAALLVIVGFVPLPAWVSGEAQLLPAVPVAVRAGTDGTVEEVSVREGQEVAAGTVVARMRRDELEVELAQVRADAGRADAEAAQARNSGDLAVYMARQGRLAELQAEELYLSEELERTALVAGLTGVVLTPNVERQRGERLSRGQTFLEIADLRVLKAEVLVAQEDVAGVDPGQPARLKVHAYPGRTFRGEVAAVAPRAEPNGAFRATLRLANEDLALRPGMTGQAHISLRARPVLPFVLRPIVRRLRLALWV
jgi:RND family efflux transporter MFP subunit